MGEIPHPHTMALKNSELSQKQERETSGQRCEKEESNLESSIGVQVERP